MDTSKEGRPLNTLLADLTRDSSDLVRKEVELAKAEISEKISQLRGSMIALAVGAAIILVGLFYVLDAVVYGLAEMLPPALSPWLAALIVGVVVAAIGYGLLKSGERVFDAKQWVPRETMRSLEKDKNMLKEQV